jgi:plasmid stabilization system protein ParE
MTTYRVIIDDKAIEDIERNARWWAENHSPVQALRWYELAFKAIYSLDTMPTRHGLSPENADFLYEIRDLLFGFGSRPSYRAIFTIQEDTVHVLTVHRSAQDTLRAEDIAFDPNE